MIRGSTRSSSLTLPVTGRKTKTGKETNESSHDKPAAINQNIDVTEGEVDGEGV